MSLTAKIVDSLDEIPAIEWNKLIPDSNPFIRHEFLAGLERYNCLDSHGWSPAHIVIYDNKIIVAAMPMYIKTNSTGEFVFDWSWAEAFQNAGGEYYPKLVSAIPFAPVAGPRILIDPKVHNMDALIDLLISSVCYTAEHNNFSSFHCLFPDESQLVLFENYKMNLRMSCQYHWFNNNYNSFDEFLDTLDSKHRKNIKRERKSVFDQNIQIEFLKGNEISEQQWNTFYKFYCSTFYRKWGEPRLTLNFFLSMSEFMPESTILILAKKNNQYIAGAYAMCSNDTLYGRHWGCSNRYNNLHFELCYYQTIEYCIRNGLKCLNAGAQGEHKISRGFIPVKTWSLHWIRNDHFRNAVKRFLVQETEYIEQYMNNMQLHLPYKNSL